MDDYLRRRAHVEAGTDSLTPILPGLPERVAAWQEVTGKEIGYTEGDLCDWDVVERVFREFQPEAIVHYGEKPSAPVFDEGPRARGLHPDEQRGQHPQRAVRHRATSSPDAHLVKLGTMGEYGTPNIDIEEGFIEIEHNGRKRHLPFPKLPGCCYHLSKVHDSHNIHFACRIWGLRATDLNQGVVYGIETEETALDERLVDPLRLRRRVRNRAQPLLPPGGDRTPAHRYGKGGQTRGYLNIVDTLSAWSLRSRNPAETGEYRVFNQFTEQFSILQLAEHVQKAGAEVGIDVAIDPIDNPRVEAEEHYYNATHTKLLDLGLQPHLLSETLIESMFSTITRYRDRVVLDHILPQDRWRPGVAAPTA